MKKISFFALFLLLTAFLPLLSQENSTAMDRAKQIMAVRAAAKRVIEDSKTFLDTPQTRAAIRDKLSAFIQDDINSHKRRDDSRKLCLECAFASIQDILFSNVVIAVAEAAAYSPLPVTVSNVLANVDSNWTGSAQQAAFGFTTRYFDQIFTEARAKVIAEQRIEAEKKVSYPSFTELNTALSAQTGRQKQFSRDKFEAIGKWWAGEDSRKLQPLLEEVQESLNNSFYKNMANEIAVQYENQRALFQAACSNRADLSRYITAKGIHERIADLCRASLQPHRQTQNSGALVAPVYDLFEPVETEIRQTACKMEVDFFLEHIRTLSALPISEWDLTRDILASPSIHRNAQQSAGIMAQKLSATLAEQVSSDYVLRPGTEAAARSKAVVQYFVTLLAETNAAAHAWKECVSNSLAGPLRTAREKAARQQFEKEFEHLAKTEALPESVLNNLADQRNFTPFKSAEDMRNSLPDYMSGAGVSADLLDETWMLALEKANRLSAAAAQAVRGQELCLKEMEKEKLPQLETDVTARKPFAKIITQWTDDLTNRWDLQARNTSSPYRQLLGRTKDLLNKTVRQLYDSRLAAIEKTPAQNYAHQTAPLVKQEEKTKKTQDAAGGGAAEETAVRRKTRGETGADLFIVINDNNSGDCEAMLETAEGSLLARITFDPNQVESADEKIFAAMRDAIRDQIASRQTVTRGALFGLLPARRSGLKDLGVYIISQSGRVRLKTSLRLREKIEKLLELWAQESDSPAPKLRWGAGFSSEGLKEP